MSANIPAHELPNWMKQAQRGVDWGALLVLAFALLAGWSFLNEQPLSASTANEHFVFQASDIAEGMREGIFYPRWSPYAVGGYGAPIPHYYPQAAAYLVALFDILFTNDLVLALRLVYLMALLVAGASLYSLVAQHSNALVGLVAALAYLFNPYLGLTVPHLLGDLPLFLGLALIPLLLWTVNRLLLREQAIDVALMTFVIALFILTIPRLLPQALLLTLLLIGVHLAQKPDWTRLIWILGGALLGLGLAACYWLPALLESNFVPWYPALMAAEPQLLRFPEIFTQPSFLDVGFLVYENYFSLGWGLLLLTVLGGLALILKREALGFHSAFLLYGLALLLLLCIFPQQSEIIASISLCLAIGGAYAVNFLKSAFKGLMAGLLLLFLGVSAIPYWDIPSAPLPISETDALTQINYERAGYGIAVLPAGLPLPSNIAPDRPSSFNAETPPDSHRILDTELSLISEEAFRGFYQVFSTSSSQITYQRAYFMGWEAWLGNQSLPISPTEDGLMRFEIPAANASLSLVLGSTWLRSIAWLMTILALFTSSTIWWLRWRRMSSDYDNSPLLSQSESRLVFLVLLLLLGLHLAKPMWLNLPSRYSLQTATYVRSEVDSSIQLLAYEIRDKRLQLYWEAIRPTLDQYQIRLRLTAEDAIIVQTNYSHPSYFPTNRWLRGFVVPQSYGLPDGDYRIFVDVFRCTGVCGELGNQAPTLSIEIKR